MPNTHLFGLPAVPGGRHLRKWNDSGSAEGGGWQRWWCHRLPGGVAKLQCMQRHNMDFCPPHLFYLCESFWICGFLCFRPRHFQLQKSESDATSASALKISCPRSSFRWCGAERSRPEAMPSEAGIRVSWVRISNLGMIFSIFSFNYGWCSHFRSFCFFPTKPFNPWQWNTAC